MYSLGTTTLPTTEPLSTSSNASTLSPPKKLPQLQEPLTYKVSNKLRIGFVYFNHGKTTVAARRILPLCHLEQGRGTPSEADAYCRKTRPVDPTPNLEVYTRGVLPLLPSEKGDLEKQRWEETWLAAKEGRIEDIPADIRIRQYSAIRRIERDFMPAVARLGGPCGTWIVGPAGCGKTRAVLDQFPEIFPKPRNLWWDGYQREPCVLLDDIDKFDVRLGGSLKHWADAYPFIGEVKGGSQKIRPERFIVTSQYRIEEIWTDQETKDALLRRFIVVEKELGQNIII